MEGFPLLGGGTDVKAAPPNALFFPLDRSTGLIIVRPLVALAGGRGCFHSSDMRLTSLCPSGFLVSFDPLIRVGGQGDLARWFPQLVLLLREDSLSFTEDLLVFPLVVEPACATAASAASDT